MKKSKYYELGKMVLTVAILIILFYTFVKLIPTIFSFIIKVFNILAPVTIGLVLAYLINPLVDLIQSWLFSLFSHTKMKMKSQQRWAKGISITVSLVLFLAVLVVLIIMVTPEVTASMADLLSKLRSYGDQLTNMISSIFDNNVEIQQKVNEIVKSSIAGLYTWLNDLTSQADKLMSTIGAGVVGTFKAIINIILGICVAVYVQISKHKFIGQIKKMMYALLKKETVNLVLAVTREADTVFGGFISGKIIDSLIIGILCFIGCTIMGMPYTVLISVVIGVTNIVPLFGPWVGAVPSILLVFVAQPDKALIFAIFIIALQQFDGNILGPNILGDSTGLSPFWVVVAITLGGGLWGLPGMILGVPLFALFYFILKTYAEFKLKTMNMPVMSTSYSKLKRIDPETSIAEFMDASISKRERRKKKIYEDDVSREIATAVWLNRMARGEMRPAEEKGESFVDNMNNKADEGESSASTNNATEYKVEVDNDKEDI